MTLRMMVIRLTSLCRMFTMLSQSPGITLASLAWRGDAGTPVHPGDHLQSLVNCISHIHRIKAFTRGVLHKTSKSCTMGLSFGCNIRFDCTLVRVASRINACSVADELPLWRRLWAAGVHAVHAGGCSSGVVPFAIVPAGRCAHG